MFDSGCERRRQPSVGTVSDDMMYTAFACYFSTSIHASVIYHQIFDNRYAGNRAWQRSDRLFKMIGLIEAGYLDYELQSFPPI